LVQKLYKLGRAVGFDDIVSVSFIEHKIEIGIRFDNLFYLVVASVNVAGGTEAAQMLRIEIAGDGGLTDGFVFVVSTPEWVMCIGFDQKN